MMPKGLPQPKRRIVESTGTHVTVGVTPPSFVGALPEQKLQLTTDQYRRYCEWLAGGLLIQQVLPELTDSEREILLTGLGDEDFDRFTKSDDEDEDL